VTERGESDGFGRQLKDLVAGRVVSLPSRPPGVTSSKWEIRIQLKFGDCMNQKTETTHSYQGAGAQSQSSNKCASTELSVLIGRMAVCIGSAQSLNTRMAVKLST